MNFNEYQKKARSTAMYKEKHKIFYPALGLGEEAGEVLGKIKKWLRGDDGEGAMSEERKQSLKEELGDVLWYLAILAEDIGFTFEEVAKTNVEKLQSRSARNVIKGDGDKR